MPQKTFEETVIESVETIETKQEQLIKNYDQLDKDTKKAMEEFTKVKNAVDSQAEILTKLKKLQLQLRREERMAFRDPIERIICDEEKRMRFNGLVRSAVLAQGERLAEPFRKALGEDSSPGSTIIDDALAAEIYDTLSTYGKWNTLGVRRLGTKQTKYPVKTVRPIANFVLTEADTIADDTNKAGTSVTLEAEVIAALINVSRQLLDDSTFDVTADVLNDFREAFNYRLDWAAFAADGTADATDGGMTGIFEFGTAAAAAAGNVTVETTDFEDWTRCLLSVDAAVLSRMAKWWIHPFLLVRALSVKDSNGRPIFLTAIEAPSRGGIGSLLGYPVELVEAAPSTNAANAKVATFGDPQGMVVGIRQDFQFEASDHHKWNTYERSFRGIGRAGVKGRRANALSVLTLPAA